MIALALPLARFLFGALAIAVGRGQRLFLALSAVVDATLLAGLCNVLRGGTCVVTFGGWGGYYGITFSIDLISVAFVALALALSVAVTLYTWRDAFRPSWAMLVHLLVGACYALAFTQDLFNAYVLLELVTLAAFLLVATDRRPRQIWASLRYLIFSSFALNIFLFGAAVAYTHVHSLNLGAIAAAVTRSPDAPWVRLAAALLFTGAAVKAGVFVFSLWLPLAHSQAPPAVSALLSGLVVKMGVVVLYRLSIAFPVRAPLVALGGLTAILGIIYAAWSLDAKRMLAFHTLSQIGYVLIGFGAGSDAARFGALDYAVAHGLFKALLFLAVGEAAAIAGSSRLECLVAERARLPRGTRVALIIGMLGIVGLPPFAGFAAKSVLESGIPSIPLRVLFFVVSAGTALSFAKLWPLVHGRSAARTTAPHAVAYGLLGTTVVLFLPISRVMEPASVWAATLHAPAYVEALTAFAVGTAAYAWTRRVTPRLPERLFRLEEGFLILLGGFFLIYLLVGGG
ncbi:MAG: complex I subunit 5 family protein [Candidatus Bipolaricaulia bacterium]